MNIDDLLSPYRGFLPTGDVLVADTDDDPRVAPLRNDVLRATRLERGPALPSPESWEMYDFVRALTA